jgi:hypothetical protein
MHQTNVTYRHGESKFEAAPNVVHTWAVPAVVVIYSGSGQRATRQIVKAGQIFPEA